MLDADGVKERRRYSYKLAVADGMYSIGTVDGGDDIELADRVALPVLSKDLYLVVLLVERSETTIDDNVKVSRLVPFFEQDLSPAKLQPVQSGIDVQY